MQMAAGEVPSIGACDDRQLFDTQGPQRACIDALVCDLFLAGRYVNAIADCDETVVVQIEQLLVDHRAHAVRTADVVVGDDLHRCSYLQIFAEPVCLNGLRCLLMKQVA